MTTAGAQLRALIEAPEIAVLPGVHDSLSAPRCPKLRRQRHRSGRLLGNGVVAWAARQLTIVVDRVGRLLCSNRRTG